MPLVFVHGVNVRQGKKPEEKEQFTKSVNARDELFRTIGMAGMVPPPALLHIENPYWGDQAAQFAYDLVSVPAPGIETFGPSDDVMAQVLAETIPMDVAVKTQETPGGETAILLTLARTHSLMHAVDAVVAAAAVRGMEGDVDEAAQKSKELAKFAAMATAYAASNPDTSWLNATNPATAELRLQSDSDFLEELAIQVRNANESTADGVESFGASQVLDQLKGAARGLANAARRTLQAIVGAATGAALGLFGGAAFWGTPEVAVRTLRPAATQRAGIFFGDVFAYLAKRGTKEKPGPIVNIVTEALDKATAKKTTQDSNLVVIAHSMGGNIVYDILTHYRPDISVDLLVTVGSQVALFKEMQLYREDEDTKSQEDAESQSILPPARVDKPAAVKKWLNIFDPMDVLGFAVEGVFKDVRDFAFSNQASPLDTHSLYFFRSAFHQRLRARISELGFGNPT